jgi:hypothetical protein
MMAPGEHKQIHAIASFVTNSSYCVMSVIV